MTKNDKWKEKLTKKEYEILRKGATEPAFTGELLYNKEDGTYRCKA